MMSPHTLWLCFYVRVCVSAESETHQIGMHCTHTQYKGQSKTLLKMVVSNSSESVCHVL